MLCDYFFQQKVIVNQDAGTTSKEENPWDILSFVPTSGSGVRLGYGTERLVKPIFQFLNETKKSEVRDRARNFAQIIFSELMKFPDLDLLHPFHISSMDDDSIIIEWVYDDFRLGFYFDVKVDESSWFLVSKESSGGVNASGYLDQNDKSILVNWLISFVFLQVG